SIFEFKLFPRSNRTLQFDTETNRKVDWAWYSEPVNKQYNDGVIILYEYRRKIEKPPVKEDYDDKHRVSLNLVNADLVDAYQQATADNRRRTPAFSGASSEGGETSE